MRRKHSCKPFKDGFIQFCYLLAIALCVTNTFEACYLIIFHGCTNYLIQKTRAVLKTILLLNEKERKYFVQNRLLSTTHTMKIVLKMFSIDQKVLWCTFLQRLFGMDQSKSFMRSCFLNPYGKTKFVVIVLTIPFKVK